MNIGFGRMPITPQKAMTLAGFDRRTAPSLGAIDDLFVSVLLLEDDTGTRAALCSFDLLGADRALCQRIREALPLSADRVWVCATHTHSAPRGAFSGGISQDDDYIAGLVTACRAAFESAERDLSPADAFLGESTADGVASFRDVPRDASTFAMPLRTVALRRAQGEVRLTRFACHPTVLSEDNLYCSRDLPGGSETVPTLWLNGPCADLSTRFTRKESSFAEVRRLGGYIKTALERTVLHPLSAFGTTIRAHRMELELPYGSSLRGEARQRLLETLRTQAATCTDEAARRETESCIAVLERAERDLPASRTVMVGAWDLGSLVLVGLPFEVSWQDGTALEAQAAALCGKPALLVCYCNGYDGYLPHETAGVNYQDLATGYLPEARAMIRRGALDCVNNTQR
ncbi:MAG: hypothetical protein IKU58_07955 [Clostridia bacterium]|nr:hypothetical protein [Clostridia bacterium]